MGETLCGSDIAKSVYAYLHDEKCELSARKFCEESPYMHDENNLLKLGFRIRKIRQPISLYDVHKTYVDVQDFVFDAFANEFSYLEPTPEFEKLEVIEKLNLMRRLYLEKWEKCNCTCNCARRSAAKKFLPTLKRRLSATGTNEEIGQLFPTATVEQDLPGNRPPEKRRKLHDVRLLFASRGEEPTTSTETMTFDSVKTPAKTSMCLPTSATKTPGIPGDILTSSMLNLDFQNILADSINNAFDGHSSLTGQLENALPTILAKTEQNPTYDEIVLEAIQFQNTNNFGFDGFDSNSIISTSTPSKGSMEGDVIDNVGADRPLNTPEPMNESIKQRLRPRKSKTPSQTIETKRISKSKAIHVLSNETIVGPSEPVAANLNDVIVVNSDSEETVTTTSMQPMQLAQPTYFLKYNPNENNFQLEIPSESTGEQLQSLQNNLNIPIVFDSAPYQMQTFIVDPQTFVNSNEFQANQIMINPALGSMQLENVEESRNRIIVIDDNEVNADTNNQHIQSTEERTITEAVPLQEKISQNIDKNVAETKQSDGETKIGTPKEQIKLNKIPLSSRSLSTPRRRNPHVRVLDFTTPARFPLAEISEAKNESSVFNASKLFAITPQNQTITSSIPSSAPAKMSACVGSTKAKITNKIESIAEESSSADSAIPFGQENDEDTVISVGSDTPKVRKKLRRACVRTLSSHKEINVIENEKRFKRVAKTKKKICEGSDNSNDGQKVEDPGIVKKDNEPKIDAAEEWKRVREMSKNPMFLEQMLRENESKKQAQITAGSSNRRKRRPQRKSGAKTKKKPVKKSAEKSTEEPIEQITEQLNESCKSTDISLNSSLDTTLNSTQLRLEAKLLEDNLASAKKETPAKLALLQIKKKKTPAKVHIKLMPSPKVKLNAKLKKTPLKKLTIDTKIKSKAPEQSMDAVKSENVKSENVEIDNVADPTAVVATSTDSTVSNKSTQEDLEAAKELLNMQTIILQQEKEKILSESAKKQDPSASKIVELLPTTEIRSQLKDSDMTSLETPFKNESGVPLFPQTPGINNILNSMATPIIKPGMSLLDVSILKNSHLFPTPSVPITPGSSFTPLKDLISPRGDQDLIYGVANRPTDYSSSSSYYKPDESDGIDKQIHASIRSTRTNSSAYSADEFDFSQKDNSDAVFHNESSSKHNSSSSSSSSSGDSDSESDTSSSSSDSNASQIDINVQSNVENLIEQNNLEEEIRSTEDIKSHLVSTGVGIAQNILLTEPQSPIADKEAEQAKTLAKLETKRLRMKEKMLQDTQKATRTKSTGKNLISKVKRIERFRMPTNTTRSPSKRKSTLPQKFVPQTIATNVMKETQSIITQQVISEAISDNAIVDASDVSTIEKDEKMPSDSENIDAIAEHIRQTSNNKDIVVPVKEDAEQMSEKRLIGILEGKRLAKADQFKTRFIDALPNKKSTRSRTKTIINPIAPKQNVPEEPWVKQPVAGTSKATALNEQSKPEETESKPMAEITGANLIISKPKDNNFKTPAKDRRKQQMRDMFGDVTDIETPVKSPPRKPVVSQKVQTSQESNTPEKIPEKEPQPCLANSSEKENDGNVDRMNASMSSLSSDEYTSDEDEMEMTFSIDETDKKRFQFVQETLNSNPPKKNETIRIPNFQNFKRTIVIDDEKVILTINREDELFSQESKLVAVDIKNEQTKNIPKEKSPTKETEQRDKSLEPSPTQSPSKQTPLSPKPKFNIKHKNKDAKELDSNQSKACPTAAAKPDTEKLLKFNINELLMKLHR